MNAAVMLPRHKLTVTDYHQMINAGILSATDRVELIEGDLIEMSPAKPEHADYIDYIGEAIKAQTDHKVRLQNPITLPEHSEPEPDIALVKQRRYTHAHPGPEDILMLIEVADTSLDKDKQVKVPLYARFLIPEVWVVDVQGRAVDVFWRPVVANGEARYAESKHIKAGNVRSETISDVTLSLTDLWA